MCAMCPLSPVFPDCKKLERGIKCQGSVSVSQMQASSFSAIVTLVCAIELALFFQEGAVKAKSHGY